MRGSSHEVECRVQPRSERMLLLPCVSVLFELLATGPVAGELPGDASTARAARERPLERRALRRIAAGAGCLEVIEPDRDDLEIVVLVERIERNPHAEA